MADLQVMNASKLAKTDFVKQKVKEVLGNESKYFIQSVINSISSNKKLLECDGKSVWSAAMNAAVLGLPVDKNLSYSAIIPFGKKAEFQIMTKGYIQLAIDTGLYKDIHATEVYEDEINFYDPIHGKLYLTDKSNWKNRKENKQKKVIGYYAFFELNTGFYKEMYMPKEDVEAHGKKYSKSYSRSDSVWKLNFDAMGKKTVLKNLLRTYGKLGTSTQKLTKALEVDHSYSDNMDTNNPKYYDNPMYEDDSIPNVTVEVEDDFIEAEPLTETK